mgnify:CR=1 FL=1
MGKLLQNADTLNAAASQCPEWRRGASITQGLLQAIVLEGSRVFSNSSMV